VTRKVKSVFVNVFGGITARATYQWPMASSVR
jgi:succinyl-CoA synthetase beta subunit